MSRITRRKFLALSAGAAALGLNGCLGSRDECVVIEDDMNCALPRPDRAPFDTVVVLMMENRSFDHMLGWLPGANGRHQGLIYADVSGALQSTWPLAPDFQGCTYKDFGTRRDPIKLPPFKAPPAKTWPECNPPT